MLRLWREHESLVLRALKHPEILRIYKPWQPLADKTLAEVSKVYSEHKPPEAAFEGVELLYNMHKLTTSQNARAIGLDKMSPRTPFAFTLLSKRFALYKIITKKLFWDGLGCMPMTVFADRGHTFCHTSRKNNISRSACIFVEENFKVKAYMHYAIYHEFGHAVDGAIRQIENPDFLRIFNKFGAKVKSTPTKVYLERNSAINAEIAPHISDTNFQSSKYVRKLVDSAEYFDMLNAYRYIPRKDAYNGYPIGHGKDYYTKDADAPHMEFWANMVSAYFRGNQYLEQYEPELWEDIKKHVGELWSAQADAFNGLL